MGYYERTLSLLLFSFLRESEDIEEARARERPGKRSRVDRTFRSTSQYLSPGPGMSKKLGLESMSSFE